MLTVVLLVLLSWDASIAPSKAEGDERIYPRESWDTRRPAQVGMDEARLQQAGQYALMSGGSGYITRHGKLVMAWGDPAKRYDLKSTTKSIGVTALGLAIQDGEMRLNDRAKRFYPHLGIPPESNTKTVWPGLFSSPESGPQQARSTRADPESI